MTTFINTLRHRCFSIQNTAYSSAKTNQDIVTLVRFEKTKFLSFQELQVPQAQTVGNGIVVDVSKYFTKFDPIKKNGDSSARSDS
jgi:hypothetical protein